MPVPAEGQIQYQQGGAFDPKLPVRFTARVQFDGDVNLLDTVTVNATVANDNSTHFLAVEGTLPASPTTAVQGVVVNVESAGSAAHGQECALFNLLEGYTGSDYTTALSGLNAAAGTGTSFFSSGNTGTVGISFATTAGSNVGVSGIGQGGNISIGTAGLSTVAKNSATNVGVVGCGRNTGTTPVEVGVYAGLNTANPTFESAALLADNSGAAQPVILARDNGTKVWSIQDGGSIQGKMASKDLTEGVATAFVRFTLAAGSTCGGVLIYSVEALDAVDQQIISGVLPFVACNKAGTVTASLGTPAASTEIELSPVGSLTNAFTTTNAANTFDILADATSSLAQTTLRISFQPYMSNNSAITVTAV